MRRIHPALVALATLLVATTLTAETASSRVEVSAYVIGRTTGGVVGEPQALVLSAEDVARGWVEVSEPIALQIRSNQRAGFKLLASVGGPVTQVELHGLGDEWVIGGSGGWISMPYRGTSVQQYAVSCRLKLDENAAPGTYAWPVQIALAN
ncbi:MAG: hypothetical protein ACRD2J_13230 [Thermoanaerobaculia bacterium]